MSFYTRIQVVLVTQADHLDVAWYNNQAKNHKDQGLMSKVDGSLRLGSGFVKTFLCLCEHLVEYCHGEISAFHRHRPLFL